MPFYVVELFNRIWIRAVACLPWYRQQKDLAERMGKSPAEVSKWLSGLHNLTQQSIVKMEEALGADITITPEQAKDLLPDVRMVPVPVYAAPTRKHFSMESCTDAEPMSVGKANNGMKLVA